MTFNDGEDVWEVTRDMIDVTSNHRPDPSWRYIDPAGHEHRWHDESGPATYYYPTKKYHTPTLVWVKTGEEYWEDDDEPHDVGQMECAQCHAVVHPGYTADQWEVFVPSIWHITKNGQPSTREEFEARFGKS